MEFQIVSGDDAGNVTLSGRLTVDAGEVFRSLISTVTDTRPKRTRVDLSGVEFVDSAGLGMLLLLREAAEAAGTALVLINPCGQVRRLIDTAHFERLIPIEFTEEPA